MGETDPGILVQRAQQGDREAADAILRRYAGRIRAAIRRRIGARLRPRFDTDDVFQSAVAVTLEDLKGLRYRGEEALVAWLTTVAERRLLGLVRAHRAGRRDVARERTASAAAEVTAGRTSPPRAAERAELKAAVERAIGGLPSAEREVIRLRSYEGLSFTEIAERLGLASRHAARDRFLRALRKMGDRLEPGGPPPERDA